MKFESKFGLGEIVVTREQWRKDSLAGAYRDLIAKVVAIQLRLDCPPVYICRVGGTGIEIVCTESELIGDPAFDQDQGGYLDD